MMIVASVVGAVAVAASQAMARRQASSNANAITDSRSGTTSSGHAAWSAWKPRSNWSAIVGSTCSMVSAHDPTNRPRSETDPSESRLNDSRLEPRSMSRSAGGRSSRSAAMRSTSRRHAVNVRLDASRSSRSWMASIASAIRGCVALTMTQACSNPISPLTIAASTSSKRSASARATITFRRAASEGLSTLASDPRRRRQAGGAVRHAAGVGLGHEVHHGGIEHAPMTFHRRERPEQRIVGQVVDPRDRQAIEHPSHLVDPIDHSGHGSPSISVTLGRAVLLSCSSSVVRLSVGPASAGQNRTYVRSTQRSGPV